MFLAKRGRIGEERRGEEGRKGSEAPYGEANLRKSSECRIAYLAYLCIPEARKAA
jgi:hypothetical protein